MAEQADSAVVIAIIHRTLTFVNSGNDNILPLGGHLSCLESFVEEGKEGITKFGGVQVFFHLYRVPIRSWRFIVGHLAQSGREFG